MSYEPSRDLLTDRIILITGASDGIGFEVARFYAAYGAKLLLLGRSINKLKQLKHNIAKFSKQTHISIAFDLLNAKPDDFKKLASDLSTQIQRLDGLLLNAAILGEIKPIAQQNPAIWHQVMQVNVNANFMLVQVLLPLLLNAQHPSVIFTSSSVGQQGRKNWGAYSVSKFAIEGLMQILASEYQDSHLRFNAINPGATRTNMRAAAFPDENPETVRTPAEIMPAYLYLMGDDSLSINGRCLDAQPDRNPSNQ